MKFFPRCVLQEAAQDKHLTTCMLTGCREYIARKKVFPEIDSERMRGKGMVEEVVLKPCRSTLEIVGMLTKAQVKGGRSHSCYC